MHVGFRKIWPYDPQRLPSGAIPRFPLWEVTALAAAVYAGIGGFITPEVGRLIGLIGPLAAVCYGVMIFGGVVSLAGMALRAPTGMVVQLVGTSTLSVVFASIFAGVAVDLGKVWFPGSTTMLIFAVAGAWRTVQLLGQLRRSAALLAMLSRDER